VGSSTLPCPPPPQPASPVSVVVTFLLALEVAFLQPLRSLRSGQSPLSDD